MKRYVFLFLLFLCLPIAAFWAQDLLIDKTDRTRYSFAQGYVGLTTQYLPGGDFTFQDGQVEKLSDGMQPRFIIGGTHFGDMSIFMCL